MQTIALYGLTAGPPGLHHRLIVEQLVHEFGKVIVVPCGPRPDKLTSNDIPSIHRAAMVSLTFGGMENVIIDLHDLEREQFTRTYDLYNRYKDAGDLWIVVGTDLIIGGKDGQSQIQTSWDHGRELWESAKFAVTMRDGITVGDDDFPPTYRRVTPTIVDKTHFSGSSTEIRERVFRHIEVNDLVLPAVDSYIKRYGLYHGMLPDASHAFHCFAPLKAFVSFDEVKNEKAEALAERLSRYTVPLREADCFIAIGGDGTMLRTIREYSHWHKPFLGLNAGHVGFLMNEIPEVFDPETFFNQQFRIRHSPLLYVEAIHFDGKRTEHLAFTDAFTRAKNGGQTVWTEVSIDGEVRIPKLVSDGVLVSTAAGSTAYAFSMGAAPVSLESQQIVLVGNNVFRPKYWRFAYLPDTSRIVLRTLETNYRPVELFVDGVAIGAVSEVCIRKSCTAAAELAFTKEHDIARKLAKLQFSD